MRDWFTKDIYWKIFSVLMAIGIWLTVRKESETPAPRPPNLTTINYGSLPVLAVSANTDVHNARCLPRTVNVTVTGSPESMSVLQSSQIHASVNLTGISSAQNLPRDVEISLPPGVTLATIDPSQVSVTMPSNHEQ